MREGRMTAGPTEGTGAALGGAVERTGTLRMATMIMAAVVSLAWVAPLVAPDVDVSVLGLLLGTRYLALHCASREQLRPARRLLIVSCAMTLALNVSDPLLAGEVWKAAFDAVGPLLLIGWAEVGPGLVEAISQVHEGEQTVAAPPAVEQPRAATAPSVSASDSEGKETEVPRLGTLCAGRPGT
ncbi:hypothetical protein [Streptomyces silvisoli]|uniref:Holin n=1 Tax=Streptomyces silvisoli TaxID=3034235 RepID=A0ABT5ZP08_9ACTN|nr:hypothetical protein [Streptomyces silvisoli]MDF3291557.1 hypothetical protein [Streptomyces silvisoli]